MNLYPNVDTLTIDQLRDLIAAGDDSHHNQLRITSSREFFLSDIVGLEHLEEIIGRFETFVAGNGYVGLNAALDQQFIESLYTAIQTWKKSPCSYVDMF